MIKIRLFLGLMVFSNLLSVPDVFIIGDSHANWGFSNMGQLGYLFAYNDEIKIPFHIHWTPSVTMQEVNQHGLNIAHYGVRENDIAVFVFGEVDVRYNIGRQRDHDHRDLNEILDSLVVNYIRVVSNNKKHYNIVYCIVMEVMPPSAYYYAQAPFYGTIEDRVYITHELNKKLRHACEANNILFLPLHDIYANADGSFNLALSDGGVHINLKHNFHLRRRLVEMLLELKII